MFVLKIFVFVGFVCKDSVNKKFVVNVVDIVCDRGVQVIYIDLIDYEVLFYYGDDEVENGLFDSMKVMCKLFVEYDVMIVVILEYNGNILLLFVNIFDWIFWFDGEDRFNFFIGKLVIVMVVFLGGLGGVWVIFCLCVFFIDLGMMFLFGYVLVFGVFQVFDVDGWLINDCLCGQIEGFVEIFIKFFDWV